MSKEQWIDRAAAVFQWRAGMTSAEAVHEAALIYDPDGIPESAANFEIDEDRS